jgi:hypothetical protein
MQAQVQINPLQIQLQLRTQIPQILQITQLSINKNSSNYKNKDKNNNKNKDNFNSKNKNNDKNNFKHS